MNLNIYPAFLCTNIVALVRVYWGCVSLSALKILSPSSSSRGRDGATLFKSKYPDVGTLCGGLGLGHENFIPLSRFDYFWRQRGCSTRALHGLKRNCKAFVESLCCGETRTELRTCDRAICCLLSCLIDLTVSCLLRRNVWRQKHSHF
jgi:hypothetical protein